MRDKLLIFGTTSLATKDTLVTSADILDLNTPATHYTGRSEKVSAVFHANADFAAIDGYIPCIQDSADGSSWKTIMTGEEITAPSEGDEYVLPLPLSHRRYLRTGATPKSSGTFTAKTIDSWIGIGM